MKKKYFLILLSISTCLINASQDPKDALERLERIREKIEQDDNDPYKAALRKKIPQLGESSQEYWSSNAAEIGKILNKKKDEAIRDATLQNNPKKLKKIIESNGGKDEINKLLSTESQKARLDGIKAILPEAFNLAGGTIISLFDDLLSDAAFNGCDKSVNVLLEKGANPLAKIDYGTQQTILHEIAKWSILIKNKPSQAKKTFFLLF